MITCVSCQKFSLKRAGDEWARKGYGHCQLRPAFIRHSADKERDCEEFRQEEQAVVDQRKVWLRVNMEERG